MLQGDGWKPGSFDLTNLLIETHRAQDSNSFDAPSAAILIHIMPTVDARNVSNRMIQVGGEEGRDEQASLDPARITIRRPAHLQEGRRRQHEHRGLH